MTGKKGLGVYPEVAAHQGLAQLGLSWYYNWGFLPSAELQRTIEYVPMIWGENAARDLTFSRIEEPVDCLLGFNEPDNLGQANLSVDVALSFWPAIQSAGIRLGSPGAVHADQDWMLEFMKGVNERAFNVDFICVHWYDLPRPSILLDRLHGIYKLYGMPIWLTEFACVDWEAGLGKPCFGPSDVVAFMDEVLPELDRLPFIERYAWFTGGDEYATSSLFDKEGSLTEVGKAYSKISL